MAYVIPAPATPAVPVAGSSDLFPVRRVFCVGRNYAAHAREMGHDPDREAPFFFMKPADALVPGGGDVPYPPATADLHHEIELVVALGAGGKDIPVEAANDTIWGYGVGVDLTRRDVQGEAKKLGRPWDMGKGFDHSGPIAALHPKSETGLIEDASISLEVDGPSPVLEHHPSDLVGSGDDLVSVRVVELPRGSDLHRHAGRGGRRGEGQPPGGQGRRPDHSRLHPRLTAETGAMRITTWNINSVRSPAAGLEALEEVQPDVLCLQETKATPDQFPAKAFAEAGYPHQIVQGMKGYNGVAIVSRVPIEDSGSRDWCGKPDARHAAGRTADGIEVHCFYVPSGGDVPDPSKNEKFKHKLDFLAEMRDWFGKERKPSDPMVLVGDLNIVPLENDVWSHKQLLDVVSHTPVEVDAMEAFRAGSTGWTAPVTSRRSRSGCTRGGATGPATGRRATGADASIMCG